MLKTLDRYILRAFFTNYVIALAVMMGLYVMLDLFVNLDEFTKIPGEPLGRRLVKIIDFYGYNQFLYFSQLAGVIILAAACFTLGRFHRTNEFTAVLAAGASLRRVAAPLIAAALLMNGLWWVDQEMILPNIADKLARTHDDVEGRRTFQVNFAPEPDRSDTLLCAAMFSPTRKEIRGLSVLHRDANRRLSELILADAAHWDEERQCWRLDRGHRVRFGESVTAGGVEDAGREPIEEYPSRLTPKELALQQASKWTSYVSLGELNRMIERAPNSTEFIRIKHTRLTTILINMILLLLGLPFFLNRERPPVLVAGAKCMAVCGACFVLAFLCQRIDLVGFGWNPALPAWIPVLVFAPLAALLFEGIKT